MAIPLSDNIDYKAPKLADNRTQFNGERPFVSLEEAWAHVPKGNRAPGLSAFIKIDGVTNEYVYREGVENEDLKLKSTNVDLSNYATKSEVNDKVDKVYGKDLIDVTEIIRLRNLALVKINDLSYPNIPLDGDNPPSNDVTNDSPIWNGTFVDPVVRQIVLSRLGIIGREFITTEEVELIANINGWFTNNKEITSFNEFQFFTSINILDDYAFARCSALNSIILPNSITKLGVDCFGGCKSLTPITIPENVTSLGDYCFYDVFMDSITFLSTNPPTLNTQTISRFVNKLYIPIDSIERYKESDSWIDYKNKIKSI